MGDKPLPEDILLGNLQGPIHTSTRLDVSESSDSLLNLLGIIELHKPKSHFCIFTVYQCRKASFVLSNLEGVDNVQNQVLHALKVLRFDTS